MKVESYEQAYELLNDEAETDLRTLEELVNDAVEGKQSMTSASLPEGFTELEKTGEEEERREQKADFYFQASKRYDDGTEIEVQYSERTHSFRPESSSVQINVDMPLNFTQHWDQRM